MGEAEGKTEGEGRMAGRLLSWVAILVTKSTGALNFLDLNLKTTTCSSCVTLPMLLHLWISVSFSIEWEYSSCNICLQRLL